MIKHKAKEIQYAEEITFKSIPKEKYHEEIAKLDKQIREDLRKNEIAERISNESAKHFHTTAVQPEYKEIER